MAAGTVGAGTLCLVFGCGDTKGSGQPCAPPQMIGSFIGTRCDQGLVCNTGEATPKCEAPFSGAVGAVCGDNDNCKQGSFCDHGHCTTSLQPGDPCHPITIAGPGSSATRERTRRRASRPRTLARATPAPSDRCDSGHSHARQKPPVRRPSDARVSAAHREVRNPVDGDARSVADCGSGTRCPSQTAQLPRFLLWHRHCILLSTRARQAKQRRIR